MRIDADACAGSSSESEELLVADLIMSRRFLRFCQERRHISPKEVFAMSTKKQIKLIEEWLSAPI